ncbi:MAG: GxxExxY protein [Pseudomonadota bacterium]
MSTQRRRGAEAAELKTNELTALIIEQAIEIHRALGPGLLETVYETVLEKKLSDSGLKVGRQIPMPVRYEGLSFKEAFRIDPFVEDRVVLEIKATEAVAKVHKRQLLTYLKLSGASVGLLLNFGAAIMRSGIVRVVNQFNEQ